MYKYLKGAHSTSEALWQHGNLNKYYIHTVHIPICTCVSVCIFWDASLLLSITEVCESKSNISSGNT